MGYVACLGQIPEETAHVLQNLVSANGLTWNVDFVSWTVESVAQHATKVSQTLHAYNETNPIVFISHIIASRQIAK